MLHVHDNELCCIMDVFFCHYITPRITNLLRIMNLILMLASMCLCIPYDCTYLSVMYVHMRCMVHVGFAVYPDGHSSIPPDRLLQAALDKQALLLASGVQGSATTQMCFNSAQTIAWVEGARKAGFHTPIKLGMPGN
jgi:5,10-methylenetetrahydrofolate reductase